MSNLSNLYISQSYYGVVNLVDSTQPFASQSQTQIQFQDGVGESLGMSVTDVKDFIFDNNVVVSQSLEVLGTISGSILGIGNVTDFSQSVDNRLDQLESDTGSQDGRLDSLEAFTASQDNINQGYNTFTQSADQRLDSIEAFTSSLVTDFVTDAEYSSSIAVVSGSLLTTASFDNGTRNLTFTKGDSSQFSVNIPDVTGSIGNFATTGSNTFTGPQTIDYGNASIPTITVGNVAQTWLGGQNRFAGVTEFNSSTEYPTKAGIVLRTSATQVQAASGTTDIQISNRYVETKYSKGSFYIGRGDTDNFAGTSGSLVILEDNNQLVLIDSNSTRINTPVSVSGSLEVQGTSTFSGSVQGIVNNITIVSQTASMDCSLGNFFTLELASGSITRLEASNIRPGQTISFKVNQPSVGFGDIDFDSTFKFKINNSYVPTFTSSVEDIISFVSYDSNYLYGVSINNLV